MLTNPDLRGAVLQLTRDVALEIADTQVDDKWCTCIQGNERRYRNNPRYQEN